MPTAIVRLTGLFTGLILAGASPALAQQGEPVPWQLGFQPAATPIMEQINSFHNFVTIIIVLIALFVLGLLVYVMVRFNEAKNPLPSKTHHNTPLEIAWTVIPILILVAIAIPSFRLLFAQYDPPPADLTIKAIGSQWYWTYEYPDHDDLTFDSIMLEDDELEEGQPRLLAVDNDVVVPVNATVHMLLTANDVIHAWTIPAFGVKVDAVPGRLTKLWFRAEQPGIYYGQCSELCGQRHAFMPIAVRVVSQEDFDAWVSEQQTAARNGKNRNVASVPAESVSVAAE
jgi:cytochrome c oxidase subunit II